MGNDTNNRVISVLFSRPLLTPVIYTVTDRDTSCVQITLMMHCDYFFPQLGSWRKAVWFKRFLFLGVPCLGVQTDQQTQETPDTLLMLRLQIWLAAPFYSLLYSVIMTHLSYFVIRGLSSEVSPSTIKFLEFILDQQ